MIRLFAIAAILMTSTGAQASQFVFSFSDTQNLFGSETLAGTGTIIANYTGAGIYQIASLSGTPTIDGNEKFPLSLTKPGTQVVNSSNDNILQYPAPIGSFVPTFFDENGLGFSANGVNYDLYGIGEGFAGYELTASDHIPFGAASVSVAAAVPEPSTWAMMLLGFGGLGFLAYRKAQKGSAGAGMLAA